MTCAVVMVTSKGEPFKVLFIFIKLIEPVDLDGYSLPTGTHIYTHTAGMQANMEPQTADSFHHLH